MDSNKDIYYSHEERETFRGAHPPSAPHEVDHFRFERSERTERWDTAPDYRSKHGMQILSESQYTYRNQKIAPIDVPIPSAHFEMATLCDCYDLSARRPLVSQHAGNSEEHGRDQNLYFSLPIPDMPIFLQLTHFYLQQRTWPSIEEQINNLLSVRASSDFASEYATSEFMWLCKFTATPCSFQIRAYVSSVGDSIVIEMQRVSGSAATFSEFYHSMRSELLRGVQPLIDTESIFSNNNQNADNRNTNNNDRNDTDEMNIDHDDTDSLEADHNFLLIPVLEMLRSHDYPDMQYEALKMTCELSGNSSDGNSNENENQNQSNDNNSNNSLRCDNNQNDKTNVNCNDSSDSTDSVRSPAHVDTREQMRCMGFLPVLVDIACRHLTIRGNSQHSQHNDSENTNNFVHTNSPYTGLRAMTAILNISSYQNNRNNQSNENKQHNETQNDRNKQSLSALISGSGRAEELLQLISFISVNGLPSHSQSSLLQCLSRKLLALK